MRFSVWLDLHKDLLMLSGYACAGQGQGQDQGQGQSWYDLDNG